MECNGIKNVSRTHDLTNQQLNNDKQNSFSNNAPAAFSNIFNGGNVYLL